MGNSNRPDILVTGVGVTASIGQGKEAYWSALLSGRSSFHFMQRPGRQKGRRFIGAEIAAMEAPDAISSKLFRKASFSGQVSLVTLYEAWVDAKLDLADPSRIGLIIGGSNVQQREMVQIYETYYVRAEFVPPSYGLSFMDSDLCGLCTEQFGIQGLAYTVGVDYLNPHGSGSPIGDETELRAIRDCGLSHVKLNATKSITDYGLTAASAVEVATTLLQMRESRVHPSNNLENPLVSGLNWVGDQSIPFGITNALSLSFGFGGINTAICFQNI